MSRQAGQWADPARLHPPRHHGRHFDVASYLPFPRSPQGHPFLTQAGSSPPGVALAARYADAVFTPLAGIAAGVTFRRDLRAQAAGYGRDPGHVRVLPGLSFLIAGTDAEAAALKDELEAAASSEFRWRNLANLAGLDYATIDPDAPFPPGVLASAPKTSFGAAIYQMAAEEPGATFRAIAQKLSALPGGLDFTGTPEGLAQLMTDWWDTGAADGFTIMPNVLPGQLAAFVDHVVPILQKRGLARTEYAGTTLRDHAGLPRPAASLPAAAGAAVPGDPPCRVTMRACAFSGSAPMSLPVPGAARSSRFRSTRTRRGGPSPGIRSAARSTAGRSAGRSRRAIADGSSS